MDNTTAAPKRLLGVNRNPEPALRPRIRTQAPLNEGAQVPAFSPPPSSMGSAPSAGMTLRPMARTLDTLTAPHRVYPPPMRNEQTEPLSKLIPKYGSKDIDQLFKDLVSHGVSDVHMTRSVISGTFTVEARVDSHMQLVHTYLGSEAQTICTKIKTGSKMSTGANLIPEDGSYPLPIDDYPYRVRAVALPLFDGGERLVFRLPQTGRLRALEEVGFTAENLEAVKSLLSIPGGMTLFAGPTGEGKSTTALTSLDYLRTQDGGVVFGLEDPVERVLPDVCQMEVNGKVDGASFGDMMKYLVRSDANVIFVGEIRDEATASAAIEIAKSGRRVIATIHATDNISAFLRLISLADEKPLSVLDSVNGVISQRLVPRLVPGTERFSDRYPIHEVTANSDELTDALVDNTSRAVIRDAAAKTSTTFKQNVDILVEDGITTRAEARKVVRNV